MPSRTRGPKPITASRLRNIALAYVERHGGSEKRLLEVLRRRIARAHDAHGGDMAQHLAWAEETVASLREARILDEGVHASRVALTLHLGGRPEAVVRRRLREKGYGAGAIEEALDLVRRHRGEDPDVHPDWVAACRFARRRALGPFARPGRERPREKQLATLLRAGFGYGLASRVLSAPSAQELEDAIFGA